MNTRWGIDLGGTKIEAIVLNAYNPSEIIARKRIPTEAAKGYGHILNQIQTLITQVSQELGEQPNAIGIGTPGTLDPGTQTMKNSNTTSLNGMPFKRDLEVLLRIPVYMANDANCFALAETHVGAVAEHCPDAEVVFGVIMGTGVGGGIVVNGKIIGGRHGIGGEWGHNFLDESGGVCYCGKVGCVETVISGANLERYYKEQSGTFVKLKELMERYHAGTDPLATHTIQRLIHFFGKAIAQVINILDPDVIVIGGGVGNIDLLYTEGVKAVEAFIFNPSVETKFLKPKLGDSAGVFGAAFLVPEKELTHK